MILSQISYLDCIVFLIFLVPQLLINVGLIRTATWLVGALPSIGELPLSASSSDIHIHSHTSPRNSIPIHQGEILYTLRAPQSICTARDSVPRLRHSMR